MQNKLNNMPIGFFDSGVGGLSVYARFKKRLPSENTIYFGDLVHLPYGDKTKDELTGFAKNILNFYAKKSVKAVVIACNTSSAQAYDTIKNDYDFKIYPIIQSCAKVIAKSGISNIGIFATKGTVNSGAYTKEIHKYNPQTKVKEVACPEWVDIVESGQINSPETAQKIEKYFKAMGDFQAEKYILGCTHYPYLLNRLTEYAPKESFIDPAEIFVDFIENDLRESGLLNNSYETGKEFIYVSAFPENFAEHSKLFYKTDKLPEVVKL